eukprot:CAMPEP_0195287754 /NCGR_PEP_ID=MMETSP0707-20130614/4693_1 /TAXON_ID=33640 /ORGANISM="Asterionellopsis glacialis, Strain CCMP134" /LENGTH=56 /DNA_ID=CAMNT_0040347539 /DNA_START=1 /DNA_END=167 /DNA_ORIENTATION=-
MTTTPKKKDTNNETVFSKAKEQELTQALQKVQDLDSQLQNMTSIKRQLEQEVKDIT